MAVKLHKFGGASVKDADHIHRLPNILSRDKSDNLLLVVSAMGKTTNALEKIYSKYLESGETAARNELDGIIDNHLNVAGALSLDSGSLKTQYNQLVSSAFEKAASANKISNGAVYDQIVSLGELFSTTLIAMYLNKIGMKSIWCDVRELIQTDNSYRDGTVDFSLTQNLVQKFSKEKFSQFQVVVTQGFIGRSNEGLTITLGREGSDFTAAILAYCLDVEELSIWKDVAGVLTADPRKFDNVEKLDRMSYKEAIEMTYYGAQVIHPKTIRPLQNKGIKLNVKSFINPDAEGTIISSDGLLNYPPIVVIQEDVILMHISSKDFSFIAENHLSKIFALLNRHRIKLCTMKNSAISFSICIKNPGKEEFDRLMDELELDFAVDLFKNLQLYTLRYFNQDLIKKLTKNKVVLFEERMKYTIQIVVRPSLELKEKNI